MIYRFERRGRKPTVILVVVAVWTAILAGWLILDITPIAVVFFGAFTLPAVWDIWRDTRAFVEIWSDKIVWSSTFGKGECRDIAHVRLNRRFDGSMKITLVHHGGATTRLPADIAPPTAAIETALNDAGFSTQKHPFSPI